MSSTLQQTMSLRADAEDITNSLNNFFTERQAAIELQNEAWHNYDLELLEIGEVEEEDDGYAYSHPYDSNPSLIVLSVFSAIHPWTTI